MAPPTAHVDDLEPGLHVLDAPLGAQVDPARDERPGREHELEDGGQLDEHGHHDDGADELAQLALVAGEVDGEVAEEDVREGVRRGHDRGVDLPRVLDLREGEQVGRHQGDHRQVDRRAAGRLLDAQGQADQPEDE